MSSLGFFRELMTPSKVSMGTMAIKWLVPTLKKGEACLVIKGDSRILGTALLKRGLLNDRESWWIYQFRIRWNYRRLGLGRKLFEEILKRAKKAGIEKIYTVIRSDNRSGLAFCKATGANIVDSQSLLYFADIRHKREWPVIILSWDVK